MLDMDFLLYEVSAQRGDAHPSPKPVGGSRLIFEGAAAQAAFSGAMSMSGAAVSAGMGFANPSGSVSTEAQELEKKVIENFCAGIEYLDIAHGEIVADLGQLTAMEQMMANGVLTFTGEQFNDSLTAANTARQVWAYQQFASMDDHGWRAGYCEAGKTCVMNPKNTSGPPGDYAYKALPVDGDGTPNCDHDPFGTTLVTGWKNVIDLGVDPDTQMFMPGVPAARTSVGTYGSPYDALFQNGDMGLLGWRLPTHSCIS